jgi:hypothetical protein
MGKQARLEFESKYTAEKSYSLLMEIYQRAGAIETGLVPAEAEVGIGISQA